MFKMSNQTYDFLKYLAQIAIPAISTFIFAVFKVWGIPYGPEIVGTLSAVDILLGALLKISTDQYYEEESKNG